MSAEETGQAIPPVSQELAYAVIGAVRLLGPLRPDGVVGVEHLVVSLALRSMAWRRMVGSRLGRLKPALRALAAAERVADLPPVASPAELEIDGLLREATWLETRAPSGRRPAAAAGWSTRARAALHEAMNTAIGAGRPFCGVPDLSQALLASRRLGAIDFLRAQLIRPDLSEVDEAEAAWVPAVASMRVYRVLGRAAPPAWSRLVHRLFGVADAFFATEMEANRQAVRLGQGQVTGAHLMLAVTSVDAQLSRGGVDPAEDPIGIRTAAAALRECGLSYANLALAGGPMDPVPRPDAPRPDAPRPDAPRSDAPRAPHRAWRANPRGPSWTVAAAAMAERARTASEPGAVALVRAGLTEDVAAPDLVRRGGAQPEAVLAALDRIH
jgi:hypothetical protein